MKDEFVKRIGIWGQRHYNYLKRKSPTVINAMRMKGTLEQYLQDVDRDAEEMFSQLVKQLAERDGIPEKTSEQQPLRVSVRLHGATVSLRKKTQINSAISDRGGSIPPRDRPRRGLHFGIPCDLQISAKPGSWFRVGCIFPIKLFNSYCYFSRSVLY